ncbi:hypothetical protein FVE85_4218 [Porphyridium purpureum]|uniref:Uncharacterized protein n=1 Tax=Porphyridium purpureum TaxID=35688 RepID=A0A5J4YU02_PORPP|nr:hypothetical protein FVE85_4218 [Porphyridium purpureum]|eukprot:POR3278..scf229_5
MAAFDAMNRAAEEHCAALGDGSDDPSSVSELVMDAMFHSCFAPSLVSFQDRKGHSVIRSVHAYLTNLEGTDVRLVPSLSARYTYHSEDRRNKNDESACYTGRLVRNDAKKNVRKGTSNPVAHAGSEQKSMRDFCGKKRHMRAVASRDGRHRW